MHDTTAGEIILTRKPSERRKLIQELRNYANLPTEGDASLDPLIEVMNRLAADAADEIEQLAKRLEIWEVYEIKAGLDDAVAIPMPDNMGHWDGIACRDAAIKALEDD